MIKFLRLILLRPIERFLTQWISISTEPSAFVRERIRLGDTTNFLKAAGFFLSAISTAFLAEVATLYFLGIGSLSETYFWLFTVLTSVPFVIFCFLLVRPVEPFAMRDVRHLSLYPVGAGVFTGAVFALIASATIALLVSAGIIPNVIFDLTQYGTAEQINAIKNQTLHDCLKQESLLFTVMAAGFQEPYTKLRPPIDAVSFLRPAITILYLVIAARMFMTAATRRKRIVFALVLLAGLLTTSAIAFSASVYLNRTLQNSSCQQNLNEATANRIGESVLVRLAQDLEATSFIKDNPIFDISVSARGRTLYFVHRLKQVVDLDDFYRRNREQQKIAYEQRCKKNLISDLRATEMFIFYSSSGERLTSFSIDRADCPQW